MTVSAKTGPCIVIGANGLVGRTISGILSEGEVDWLGTCNKRQEGNLLRLDITNSGELDAIFAKRKFSAVFNCANLAGGVDFCEKNPQVATDFHFKATKEIGDRCKASGAKFVFISSDYVFDGTKGPYKEDDPKDPLNLYGRLKLQAEEWIEANLNDFLIIRTTNIYGWDPQTVTPNFMMQLYRTVSSGKEFNVPSFLWGNPTYAEDLSNAILELWRKGASGIFHVVGDSFVNRLEWANVACEILELDSGLIREIKEPPAHLAPRPLKSWLDTSKFKRSFSTKLHDVRQGLVLFKINIERTRKG